MPEIGSQVGPYRIDQKLGRGGMGEVFRAWDTRLERNVALKFLNEPSGRFVIEAQAVAALQHPNVCGIFDLGPGYLVLEYLEGECPRGQQPEADIPQLLRQAAEALQAAHDRGILHRDLKPGNMIRVRGGLLKLLDFGLARRLEPTDASTTMTLAGAVVGTPAYMSPEQARGAVLDARSDLFSLGCVLYEWLTGKAPYDRGSTVATLAALLECRPPNVPPSGYGPCWDIVRRCLQADPAQRPQSAREIVDLLGRPFESAPVPAKRSVVRLLVLPLVSLTSERDDEYFAAGLADDLLNEVSRSPDLFVFARTTAHMVRALNWDLAGIETRLQATHVLDGSVRRAGGRIRVTLQLAETGSGQQIWTARFDRVSADIFAVQDEISAAVCEQLSARLRPRAPAVQSPSAHDHWLRARHLTIAPGAADHLAAVEAYEQALAIQPGNAQIAADFGFLHLYRIQLGEVLPLAGLRGARECLAKAQQAGPGEPETLGLGALVALVGDFDRARANELIDGMGPGGSSGVNWARLAYAVWGLRNSARFQEAARMIAAVAETDPLSLLVQQSQQALLYSWRRFDECAALGERMLEAMPSLWQSAWVACSALMAQGHWVRCHELIDRALAASPGQPILEWTRAIAFRREGRLAEARQWEARLETGGVFLMPYLRALFALYKEETDRALDLLEASVEARDLSVGQSMLDAAWDRLRSDPRFQSILRRMNCPEHLLGPLSPEVFAR